MVTMHVRNQSEPALRSLMQQHQPAQLGPAAVLTPHTAAPQPAAGSVSPSPLSGAQGGQPHNHGQQAREATLQNPLHASHVA